MTSAVHVLPCSLTFTKTESLYPTFQFITRNCKPGYRKLLIGRTPYSFLTQLWKCQDTVIHFPTLLNWLGFLIDEACPQVTSLQHCWFPTGSTPQVLRNLVSRQAIAVGLPWKGTNCTAVPQLLSEVHHRRLSMHKLESTFWFAQFTGCHEVYAL